MVHFPADYSHELYGSLHNNTSYAVLFNPLTNNIHSIVFYFSLAPKKSDRF